MSTISYTDMGVTNSLARLFSKSGGGWSKSLSRTDESTLVLFWILTQRKPHVTRQEHLLVVERCPLLQIRRPHLMKVYQDHSCLEQVMHRWPVVLVVQ
jgi:hypothetical protein